MMLSIKVLKITCSVKAYVLRKTRRNWNTGAQRGYAGKILVFAVGAPVCISGSCLALNFKTYMKGQPHRKSRQGFGPRATIGSGADCPGINTGEYKLSGKDPKCKGTLSDWRSFHREGAREPLPRLQPHAAQLPAYFKVSG